MFRKRNKMQKKITVTRKEMRSNWFDKRKVTVDCFVLLLLLTIDFINQRKMCKFIRSRRFRRFNSNNSFSNRHSMVKIAFRFKFCFSSCKEEKINYSKTFPLLWKYEWNYVLKKLRPVVLVIVMIEFIVFI